MSQGPMTEAMFYVLLALCQPNHGYAIMSTINHISRGRVTMGPGTLYGVLTRLQNDRLITLSQDDGRRKVYTITPLGLEALKEEYQRLTQMVADGKSLLGGKEND